MKQRQKACLLKVSWREREGSAPIVKGLEEAGYPVLVGEWFLE
jgi:hypothetical protein